MGTLLWSWLRPKAGSSVDLARQETIPPLRVESFEIKHYRGDPAQLLGTIGVLSFATRYDDHVRVECRLSEPAYCYLIALNPNGSVQLCPRAQERIAPRPTSEIVYPAQPDGYYGLTDGTGLQAFVLVASRRPLPAFAAWYAHARIPWKLVSANGLWRFDGRALVPLADPQRGIERRIPSGAPEPLAKVCEFLSHRLDLEIVYASAFPVE
jgi:hypothetical protein